MTLALRFTRRTRRTTTSDAAQAVTRERDALGERLFGALLGGMELLTVELGVRAGLYGALRDGGHASADELAARAGITERPMFANESSALKPCWIATTSPAPETVALCLMCH